MNFIISTIILLPLIGVYFVTAIDESDYIKIKKLNILVYILLYLLFLSLLLWVFFDNSTSQFSLRKILLKSISNGTFYLGIDGISLFLVILTTFLIPVLLISKLRSN